MNRPAARGSDAAQPESMRLDLFLKVSRLIPRRSLAHQVCADGAISVNGHVAKSSRLVRVGDLIEWRQRHRVTAVKVARIPQLRPGKQEAAALYEPASVQDGQ